MQISYMGSQANRLPPSSAEVENTWNYTSIASRLFISWCLIN
jgi:hypothetical protein